MAGFIATAAFDPTTPVGMADNVITCAIDQPCTTCFDLVTPVTPTGGAGGGGSNTGGTGGAAGTGAAGSGGTTGAAGSGGTAGHTGGTGGVAGSGGSPLGGASGGGTGGTVAAVCPDLNHDTISDCTQTLVMNGDFKQTSADWTPDPDAALVWTALNGVPGSGSGSLEVTNSGTTAMDASGFNREGAWQCVPVTASLTYLFAVQASVAGGQASGWGELDLSFYASRDCTGPDTGRDVQSQQALAASTWTTLTGTAQIPLGIQSIAVRLLAVKSVTGAPFKVDFDNVLFISE